VEWDETERAWFLALDDYEKQHVCPLCGMDPAFCHDYHAVHEVFERGKVETCFVSEMRESALDKYYKDDRPGSQHSQVTTLIPYETTK